MPLQLSDLKSDPLLWSRVCVPLLSRVPAGDLPKFAESAFDALNFWTATASSRANRAAGHAIDGAFTAISHFPGTYPDSACETCRRVGVYFQSRNINVAFTAIRRFEFPEFSAYTIFVADLLVRVAISRDLVKSPVEMTLRGIAFRVLFELDPQYKHWPQLRDARNECVHGLLTWGSGSDRNHRLAARIMEYVGHSDDAAVFRNN